MKALRYLAVTVVALAIGACGNKKNYDAQGTFDAIEITLSSEINGRIISFPIQEGDMVKEGEKLVQIDTLQLYLSMLQLEKSGSSVRYNRPDVNKQISALREQIRQQKRELARFEALLKDGAATRKQVDDLQSSVSILEGQLQAMLSSLNNSVGSIDQQSSAIDIQVAQIADKIEKCGIKAPVNGTILAKYAEEGEFASVGMPLLKMADLQNIHLRAYVTSAQLARLKIGDKVKVTADFGGDEKMDYDGVISWISSKSEFTPKNILTDDDRESSVYAIKINVENDGRIKIGTYGTVCF